MKPLHAVEWVPTYVGRITLRESEKMLFLVAGLILRVIEGLVRYEGSHYKY